MPWFVLSIKPARFLAFLQYCHRDKTGIFKRDMVLTDCKKEAAPNFYFWLKAKPVSADKVWTHQVFLSPFPMEHWPNLALSIKVSYGHEEEAGVREGWTSILQWTKLLLWGPGFFGELQHGGYTGCLGDVRVFSWERIKPLKIRLFWQHKSSQTEKWCGYWHVTHTPGRPQQLSLLRWSKCQQHAGP